MHSPPSYQPLRDNFDACFAALGTRGIANKQQMVDALTTRKAVERFAKTPGDLGLGFDDLALENLQTLAVQAALCIRLAQFRRIATDDQ